jgi:hypothetical protein
VEVAEVAESEHRVEILRRSQTQEVFTAEVDPDNTEALSRVLRNWLDSERIDRQLWDHYTLTVDTPTGHRQVRP